MVFPPSPYLEEYDGALRIAGTRVGLDSVVAHYEEGRTPEQIAHSFPAITLSKVYGAIAYYLENKKLIDDYFGEVQLEFHLSVRPLSETDSALFARLEESRRQMRSKRT